MHTVQALRQVVSCVKQARNAKQAMRSALALLPDLIFMDIHLPETCGLSVLETLRQSWPPQRLPPAIVILTGDNSPEMQQKLEQTAVSAILVKPVHTKQIRDLTVQLLQLDRGVRETEPQEQTEAPQTGLRQVFLEEMHTRLPELDRDISSLDWNAARNILHQLIASSAMCQEKAFENQCRLMFATLSNYPEPSAIAQAYFQFRQAVIQMRLPASPG